MKNTYAVCAFLLIIAFSFNVYADPVLYKSVKVDGRENCSATIGDKKWAARSLKIELPPGEYSFIPVEGAISLWESDYTAPNKKPWVWFVQISDGQRVFELGTQIKYQTIREAFERNKEDKQTIILDRTSTVAFWIEDTWRGKDYCGDNRGSVTVGIIKEK